MLVGPFAEQQGGDGLEQEFDIHPHGLGLDIFHIQLHLLLEGDLRTARDLPGAGDAGDDLEPAAVGQGILIDLRGHRGARTDQGHIALEDVPQLGQFVDGGLADESADAGDPRVVPHLEEDTALHLVPCQQLGLAGLGIGVHGAEFIHGEQFPPAPDPDLLEQDRSRGLDPDQQGERNKKKGSSSTRSVPATRMSSSRLTR